MTYLEEKLEKLLSDMTIMQVNQKHMADHISNLNLAVHGVASVFRNSLADGTIEAHTIDVSMALFVKTIAQINEEVNNTVEARNSTSH